MAVNRFNYFSQNNNRNYCGSSQFKQFLKCPAKAMAILNPHSQALPCEIEGEWNLVANAERAGAEVISRDSGALTVDGISVRIYVNDALIK